MLKLSKLLKFIFKTVVILLIILETILLVSILLIYRSNTELIKDGLETNMKTGIIRYRDLFVLYLSDKYYMLSEDLMLLLRTFESILNDKDYPLNKDIDSCVINGNQVFNYTNSSSYFTEWDNTNDADLDSRLRGTWFTTRDQLNFSNLSAIDQNYTYSLCSMKRLFKDIIIKQKNWKNYLGVTNDALYFAFSDSFFFKYPVFNNSYMTNNPSDWNDTSRKKDCVTNRSINSYDPICRTYYRDVINSVEKIVVSSPYKFAGAGLFGKY